MAATKEYLISVLCAGVLCGVLVTLTDNKKSSGAIIKILSGIFLAVTMVAPITKVQIANFTEYLDAITMDGDSIVDAASDALNSELTQVIKGEVESYILDKAESLGAQILVSVTMDDDSPPIPCAVQITGMISPYQKKILGAYIEETFAITEEHQQWN